MVEHGKIPKDGKFYVIYMLPLLNRSKKSPHFPLAWRSYFSICITKIYWTSRMFAYFIVKYYFNLNFDCILSGVWNSGWRVFKIPLKTSPHHVLVYSFLCEVSFLLLSLHGRQLFVLIKIFGCFKSFHIVFWQKFLLWSGLGQRDEGEAFTRGLRWGCLLPLPPRKGVQGGLHGLKLYTFSYPGDSETDCD